MELENEPRPLPSVVWLSVMVGLAEVLQQTPRAVTAVPFSAVTLPPEVAETLEMAVTAVVVTLGTGRVSKKSSSPYPVASPTALARK